jgi:hypothetical protein
MVSPIATPVNRICSPHAGREFPVLLLILSGSALGGSQLLEIACNVQI